MTSDNSVNYIAQSDQPKERDIKHNKEKFTSS